MKVSKWQSLRTNALIELFKFHNILNTRKRICWLGYPRIITRGMTEIFVDLLTTAMGEWTKPLSNNHGWSACLIFFFFFWDTILIKKKKQIESQYKSTTQTPINSCLSSILNKEIEHVFSKIEITVVKKKLNFCGCVCVCFLWLFY